MNLLASAPKAAEILPLDLIVAPELLEVEQLLPHLTEVLRAHTPHHERIQHLHVELLRAVHLVDAEALALRDARLVHDLPMADHAMDREAIVTRVRILMLHVL